MCIWTGDGDANKCVCECVCEELRERQFLCTVLYNSPTAPGRVPEGEIIHCRVCQRQGGGLSMGPPSLPCLGLPPLPARPISSARHSGGLVF